LIFAENVAQKKVALAPKKEESIVPRYEKIVAAGYEEPVAVNYEETIISKTEEPIDSKGNDVVASVPAITDKNIVSDGSKQIETKYVPKEDIERLVSKWLTSWKSGDMKTYRSCYASDFQSKGKNLNDWISYKNNLQKRSKDIEISINDLQISLDGDTALAVFVQNYSSSIFKDTGTKTLELKKINGEWNIYKEIM